MMILKPMEYKKIEVSRLQKSIRAKIIKKFMEQTGIKTAVCFSCGNASEALKTRNVNIIDISPNGDFLPLKWFSVEEIRNSFSNCFDATSGHLSLTMMIDIALELRKKLQLENGNYEIETGSGETVICMAIAFPNCNFKAIYNTGAATEYNEKAPLNEAVKSLFKTNLNGSK